MTLANLTAVPFTRDQIAVAISHSSMGAGHVGIGFHSVADGPQVLHLAWHRKLKIERVLDELTQCWAAEPCALPPSAGKQVVAFVRAVAKRGPTINYAVDFIASRGSFSGNGAYKAPKGSHGLTCASFVAEVFRGAGAPLVKSETWRDDFANREWGERVCKQLEADEHVEVGHAEAVRKTISSLRLRPFEVAGACRVSPKEWPATFDAVQGPAAQIAAELPGICPLPAQPA
ncbi:hypothetical protein [Piscinibacter gummiphilus]|uniref:hypothetical protein n=1 Tax=Piscinibacter gummiphilus TaxID=946333 RepID=UPI0012F52426|nr:hypothetical protein [Piscinibacter gummiphilus]GLS95843.1 hypothetical protein GCM10007918_31350 [Piscinibacter gummiphilus]